MMPSPLAVVWGVFAAGFDWLEAILPFLFFVFWIVSQVFNAVRRGGGNAQGPGRPAPPLAPRPDPRGPPVPAGQDAGNARAELDRQIAEFLREMTAPRKERGRNPVARKEPARGAEPVADSRPGGGAAKRPAVESARVQPAGRPSGAASPQRRTPAPRPQGTRAVRREDHPVPTVDSVAEHVKGAFSQELSHLRGAIASETAASGAIAPAATTAAHEIAAMLRSPASVRQLVILREILDRPVDRW